MVSKDWIYRIFERAGDHAMQALLQTSAIVGANTAFVGFTAGTGVTKTTQNVLSLIWE
jgi:hypothetical protein